MWRRDRKQPPDADRGETAGGERSRWTWIWRGRHGEDATTPGAVLGPWLAMTRRRAAQPEPPPCHKNVMEPAPRRNSIRMAAVAPRLSFSRKTLHRQHCGPPPVGMRPDSRSSELFRSPEIVGSSSLIGTGLAR